MHARNYWPSNVMSDYLNDTLETIVLIAPEVMFSLAQKKWHFAPRTRILGLGH